MTQRFPLHSHVTFVRREGGIALMMALIALVAMSLTAMALLRSIDTGNMIAGNYAFRLGSVQAVDVGQEAAFATVQAMASGTLNSNQPSGCTTGCSYYATMQPTDSYEIPSGLDWSTVPTTVTTGSGKYVVKVVVDRLCSVAAITSDYAAQCYVTKLDDRCSNNNASSSSPCAFPQGIYYRASIRVSGPRNTYSYAQALFVRYP